MAKKSLGSLQQHESDADLFFLMPMASGITNMHQKTRQLTRSTTSRLNTVTIFNRLFNGYQQVLHRLQEAVQKKQPNMWAAKNFQIHHNNAPAHSAHVIHAFLAKNNISLVRQAPYSPDLAQCDFWLFPKLKTILKGRRFQSRKDIMKTSMEELGSIPEEEFKRYFEKWQKRWKKCVYCQVEYFAGD